ncbi:hypothetical protein [Terrabacter sp. 2YAF2]|uniref:hypothetical protein n=1 Tax=Terrabacter sp. 2YAF2 TaxID=3233026 RepID=UPI003F9B4F06
MPAPRKYPDEQCERAIRLLMGLVEQPNGPSINGTCLRVGEQIGANGDTLRTWVKQAWVDASKQPGATQDKARIAALERGGRELRRGNAILQTAV